MRNGSNLLAGKINPQTIPSQSPDSCLSSLKTAICTLCPPPPPFPFVSLLFEYNPRCGKLHSNAICENAVPVRTIVSRNSGSRMFYYPERFGLAGTRPANHLNCMLMNNNWAVGRQQHQLRMAFGCRVCVTMTIQNICLLVVVVVGVFFFFIFYLNDVLGLCRESAFQYASQSHLTLVI